MVAAVPQPQEGILVLELANAPVSTEQRIFALIFWGLFIALIVLAGCTIATTTQLQRRVETMEAGLLDLQWQLRYAKERIRELETEKVRNATTP